MAIRLSTRSRYGLRAMIELASSHGSRPLMMSGLSASQGLSRKYLHALLSVLKGAGLVASRRGARGGYLLARPPGEVRVSEIVSALEGDLDLVPCVGDAGGCARSGECAARELWLRVREAMGAVLEGTTLADLVAAGRRRPPEGK